MNSLVLNRINAIGDELSGKGYWKLRINWRAKPGQDPDDEALEPVEATLADLPAVIEVLNKYLNYDSVEVTWQAFDDPARKYGFLVVVPH